MSTTHIQHVPKTGLAARIREAMRSFGCPFTHQALYRALGATQTAEKQRILNALWDFRARGEISRTASGRIRYNSDWRPRPRGKKKHKIYRAIWLLPAWSVNDVARLTGIRNTAYIYRLVRALRDRGLVERCGTRSMSPMPGREYLYRIVDRDKFRKEVM